MLRFVSSLPGNNPKGEAWMPSLNKQMAWSAVIGELIMRRSRSSNRNFTRSAVRQHKMNRLVPMRGGIRL